MATKARHKKTAIQLWVADNRKAGGYSSADLAAWTGVTTDTARGWESRGRPSEDVIYPHVPVPMLYRLPFAFALVAWGAWTDRRWTVPVAMLLALPVIWPGSFALLVAIPWVLERRASRSAEPPSR